MFFKSCGWVTIVALICICTLRVNSAPLEISTPISTATTTVAEHTSTDFKLASEAPVIGSSVFTPIIEQPDRIPDAVEVSPSEEEEKLAESNKIQPALQPNDRLALFDSARETNEENHVDNTRSSEMGMVTIGQLFVLDPTNHNGQEGESQPTEVINIFEEEESGEEDANFVDCGAPECELPATSLDDFFDGEMVDAFADALIDLGQCLKWCKAQIDNSADDVKDAFSTLVDIRDNLLKCQRALLVISAVSQNVEFQNIDSLPSAQNVANENEKVPEYISIKQAPTMGNMEMGSEAYGNPNATAAYFQYSITHANNAVTDGKAEDESKDEKLLVEGTPSNDAAPSFEYWNKDANVKSDSRMPVPVVAVVDADDVVTDNAEEADSTKDVGYEVFGRTVVIQPLYFFPIVFVIFFMICVCNGMYNTYYGKVDPKMRIIKVPRMGVSSEVPTLSALPPAMRHQILANEFKKYNYA